MNKLTFPSIMTLVLFVLGCTVALYESEHLESIQRTEKVDRFDALAERAVRQLNRRMQVYEYGLRGARGAVITAGPEGLTREKFLAYSRSRELEREFPGARGFGFIRRVAREDEAAFVQAARADGWPTFAVRQLTPHDGERLVIQYLEPSQSNREAVGLDIASEESRLHTANEAMRSGRPTLTPPITLVQASGKGKKGLLFMLPIYRMDAALETSAQRWQAAFGLAYTPLVIDEVLADFDLANGDFSLALHDVNNPAGPVRFFASEGADEAPADGLVKRISLPMYGSEWLVEIRARSSFIASLNHLNSSQVAGQIVGASFLLAIMAFLVLHNLERRRMAALDHAKLAAIVESSTDAIIGKDLNGVVTSWNRAAETIFGYSPAEAIGRRLGELIVPPQLAAEEVEILALIGQGKSVPHRTAVRRRKDGELIDVSVTVSPIRDSGGRVIGASKTVRDVSAEIRRERRFKLAIDAAGVGVWVWHLQTNQLSWDQRMLEMYGAPVSLNESGLHYDFWRSHVHPDDIGLAEEKLHQHIAGEGAYDPIFRIVRDDGEVRWIQASAIIEHDHAGKPLQMVGTNLDITEHTLAKARILELNASLESQVEQRTQELQAAVAAAQRANEAKSEFLSNMSHEIRTPMNAVMGLAYLLQKQDLPGESQRMVEKIYGAGQTLLCIINDILDFSKIEAKRLEIEDVPFRLGDVLDNVANIMGTAVGDKPVETVIAPPPLGADYLKGDGLRLGQVLINLVSNAIKFTARGEVVVNIALVDVDHGGAADRVRLRFSVRDTGIGIPKDKQAAIFKAFSQADSSTTRSYGGTGLGLTISSRLVELMGGALAVRSEPGLGSEFYFEIEFGLTHPANYAIPDMAHQRVLIADDHPSARAILAETVASLGWHAEAAASGEEAIHRACDGDEMSYDVLLIDWRMPRVNGLQAAQEIRACRANQPPPIIIMVTAFDRELLRNEPGAEVADVILTKPVTSSCVYNAVQLAKSRRGALTATRAVSEQAGRLDGVQVLVVDDSEINREVAARILEGEGAQVDLASDGSVALEVLGGRSGAFDVVLMDMQMPVMDGYAATRALRAMPALAHLPVIALTAGAFATQRNQAIDAGADAFVAKPFDVEELIGTILRVAAPRAGRAERQVLAEEAPVAAERGALAGRLAGRDPGTLALLNAGPAIKIWKDDASYGKYLRKFADAHGTTVEQMFHAEADEARRLAHKLRGTAAQLGLERVAAVAEMFETCRDNDEEADRILGQLQAAMRLTLVAIDDFAPAMSKAEPTAPVVGPLAPVDEADRQSLALAFQRLSIALDNDDIRTVEAILAELTGRVPEKQLAPLRSAVSHFDLRRAEALLDSVLHPLAETGR